jgi:hypothetical protein
MGSQGERLKNTHTKVKETQDAAYETRQLLSAMANKALRNKVNLPLRILLILLLTILLCAFLAVILDLNNSRGDC